MRNIYVIGIGMGNPNTITVNGRAFIEKSTLLIGAKRMTDSFLDGSKQAIHAISPTEIMSFIDVHSEVEHIAVLMSGDLGFFSGAAKLRDLVKEKYGSVFGNQDLTFEYVPGISSLSYFSAAVGMSWEDARIVSLHGRKENDVAEVLNNKKTFFLTDGTDNTVKLICSRLTAAGLGHAKVFVGERLSYEDEKITINSAKTLCEKDFEPLSVMMVLNDETLNERKTCLGIDDDEFIRGQVPMTKEEVRTLAVSKLRLKETDVVYDIGAGTGSISVEAALSCSYGQVFAIETNVEGIALIEKNREKFNAKNMQVINGMAPKALMDLPKPDKAFIGGSKGNMDEIIELLLSKNPKIRIVIDVVSLESLAEVVNCMNKYNFVDIDITQVTVAKAKKLGNYNLMMGQNPVYIIALQSIKED